MPTITATLSQDADPSDPYTEARWEQADRDRKAWLDQTCKRELEILKAERARHKRNGKSGGKVNGCKPLTRSHAQRPGSPLTYCGRTVGPARKPGTVLPGDLSETPTCRTCSARLAALPASR